MIDALIETFKLCGKRAPQTRRVEEILSHFYSYARIPIESGVAKCVVFCIDNDNLTPVVKEDERARRQASQLKNPKRKHPYPLSAVITSEGDVAS